MPRCLASLTCTCTFVRAHPRARQKNAILLHPRYLRGLTSLKKLNLRYTFYKFRKSADDRRLYVKRATDSPYIAGESEPEPDEKKIYPEEINETPLDHEWDRCMRKGPDDDAFRDDPECCIKRDELARTPALRSHAEPSGREICLHLPEFSPFLNTPRPCLL